jgi:hypothetical protein|eukprot:COSAG06_NODE_16872_length_976_cov_0.868871_1_plen_173_part_00
MCDVGDLVWFRNFYFYSGFGLSSRCASSVIRGLTTIPPYRHRNPPVRYLEYIVRYGGVPGGSQHPAYRANAIEPAVSTLSVTLSACEYKRWLRHSGPYELHRQGHRRPARTGQHCTTSVGADVCVCCVCDSVCAVVGAAPQPVLLSAPPLRRNLGGSHTCMDVWTCSPLDTY